MKLFRTKTTLMNLPNGHFIKSTTWYFLNFKIWHDIEYVTNKSIKYKKK
jgi:hypothetical protein